MLLLWGKMKNKSHRPAAMQSTLKAELELIIANLHLPDNWLISITRAELNDAMTLLKVGVSVFGGSVNEVLEKLNKKKHEIRALLAGKVRMKYVPEISFKADDSIERTIALGELYSAQKPEES